MIDKIKTWITKKVLQKQAKATEPVRHTWNDEDREKSAIVRREQAVKRQQLELMESRLAHLQEIQRMEQMQEKIELLEGNLYGDEEGETGNPEDVLLSQLLQKLFNNKPQEQPQQVQPTQQTKVQEGQQLTDEQIQAMVDSIPNYQLNAMRQLSNEELVRLAKQKFPYFNDVTIEKAIKIARGI